MTHTERWERRKRIAERIAAGESPETLQKEYCLSPSSVNKACTEFGVKLIRSRSGTKPPLTVFRFIALLQNTTMRKSAIARELGISRQLVEVYCARAIEAGIVFVDR